MQPSSRGGHDLLLAGVAGIEHPSLPPLAHDEDPIAHGEHFGKLRGDHHDSGTACRQPVDDLIDLDLAADINSASGLIEQQHARRSCEPLGEHYFLLVAPGERLHFELRIPGVDVKLRDQLVDCGAFGVRIDYTGVGIVPEVHKGHVLTHGQSLHQALALAILGDEAETLGNGLARTGDRDHGAIEADPT